MTEAYKDGLRSILEKLVDDVEALPSADESEMQTKEPETASTSEEIKRGIDEIVTAAKNEWANSLDANHVISSTEELKEDISSVCKLLKQSSTLKEILTVYLNGNSGNVYSPDIDDIRKDLTDSVYSILAPTLKKIIISKDALEEKLHPKDEFAQTDQEARIEKKKNATALIKTFDHRFKGRTKEDSEETLKRIQKQNANKAKGLGSYTRTPEPKVSLDTEQTLQSINADINKRETYSQCLYLIVGEPAIKKAREKVFKSHQISKREEIMNRKYVVNQAYSYEKNFIPDFHGMWNPLKLSKRPVNLYYKWQEAWKAKFNQVGFKKAYEAIEKLNNKEKLTKEEKEITDVYESYINARGNLSRLYKGVASKCRDAIRTYKALRKSNEKPFDKESTDSGFEIDAETGEYILPASREFYPYFFEFFVRSFMLPEFAYKYGRGMSMSVELEGKGKLTEQEKINVAFSKKDSFRQIKDLFERSRQKGSEGTPKFLVHMTGQNVEHSLWTEAFEMLSHTTNYEQWCKLIDTCVTQYKNYIKKVDEMYGYLSLMAVLFDFPTPNLDIEGYSAGDAHDLKFGDDSKVILGDKETRW